MADVDRLIMPGLTHWHHPHFFAYFPTAQTWPSIVADILSGGLACIGFTWIASPVYTELEVCMMDWLAKLLKLPDAFLSSETSGGVIQGSASEATLMCMMAARHKSIADFKKHEVYGEDGSNDEWVQESCKVLSRLVVYFSDQAHSGVERAALMSMMRIRKIKSNDRREMCIEELKRVVERDVEDGLIPSFLVATVGTTSSCAFDNLEELGKVADKHSIWMHVDAAYAGSACICPEYRYLLNGVEYAMSFSFNPHKWLNVNHDCSALWLRRSDYVTEPFCIKPAYLKSEYGGKVPEYRNWQFPLGRRFRSLKLWFVLRCFGVERLQMHIREHIRLAKLFETLIVADDRFEVVEKVVLGLVCFRLKGDNALNKELYGKIRSDGRIHLIASQFDSSDLFFLRFALCALQTKDEDVKFAYDVIAELAQQTL